MHNQCRKDLVLQWNIFLILSALSITKSSAFLGNGNSRFVVHVVRVCIILPYRHPWKFTKSLWHHFLQSTHWTIFLTLNDYFTIRTFWEDLWLVETPCRIWECLFIPVRLCPTNGAPKDFHFLKEHSDDHVNFFLLLRAYGKRHSLASLLARFHYFWLFLCVRDLKEQVYRKIYKRLPNWNSKPQLYVMAATLILTPTNCVFRLRYVLLQIDTRWTANAYIENIIM